MRTPEHITHLGPGEVFVFGSNDAGRHGKGAARQALVFGAAWGKGRGVCGPTYAIATKDENLRQLPLPEIEKQVKRFLRYAGKNQKKRFLVTPIGCGLAGYRPEQIAFFFKNAPGNVILPKKFMIVLEASSC